MHIFDLIEKLNKLRKCQMQIGKSFLSVEFLLSSGQVFQSSAQKRAEDRRAKQGRATHRGQKELPQL